MNDLAVITCGLLFKVMHRRTIGDLERQLDDAESKITAQNQKIQQLQEINMTHSHTQQSRAGPALAELGGRGGGGGGVSNKMWSRSSRTLSARYLGDTIAFKNKQRSTVPYDSTRSRKHDRSLSSDSASSSVSRTPPLSPTRKALGGGFPTSYSEGQKDENITAIFEALEKEGYSLNEMTLEEIIVHLWRVKEGEIEKADVSVIIFN